MAIIHLVQPLPVGSSDLPGGRSRFPGIGRAALVTPPYLVLHREEFAWPHMSPCTPVRSYIKPYGRTVSPITPTSGAGLFSVALVVAQQTRTVNCRNLPDAPPLAGSLPCGVRTFLPRLPGGDRPTCSIARQPKYSIECSTRIALANDCVV
jgi:hypothetical protein